MPRTKRRRLIKYNAMQFEINQAPPRPAVSPFRNIAGVNLRSCHSSRRFQSGVTRSPATLLRAYPGSLKTDAEAQLAALQFLLRC